MNERLSPNWDERGVAIDLVVLHYTGMPSAAAALDRLCDPAARVSAHWLIDEDGALWRLVPEEKRAWHAGVSSWGRRTDTNARSIGVELVNPGHEWGYRPFPDRQIDALLQLLAGMLRRHAIPAANVVGHADVAPLRKQDPGELFPWARLAAAGIGLWPGPDCVISPNASDLGPGQAGPAVLNLQIALDAIGYGVEGTGLYDPVTAAAVTAFQRRFRPRVVDGVADAETQSLALHLAGRL